MKNQRSLLPKVSVLTLALISALFLFCKNNPLDNVESPDRDNQPPPPPPPPNYSCVDSPQDGLNRSEDNLGIADAVVIKFREGSNAEIDNPLGDTVVNVTVDGGHVIMKNVAAIQGGTVNIVLSGVTSNGSFRAYAGDYKSAVRLYLNGVNITNPTGPAVSFPKGKNIDSVSVNIVGGCGRENRLSDSESDYVPILVDGDDEKEKGTFFCEAAVEFTGSGLLEVRSKSRQTAAGSEEKGRHAIVVDNSFSMKSGNVYIYESTADGVHVNDRVAITGGTLYIKSEGEAIQNEKAFNIAIGGGAKLNLYTSGVKSHGISCDTDEKDVIIEGNANVKIRVDGNGSKGIRARGVVNIKGGNTVIDTYGGVDLTTAVDDEDNTSSASGIKANISFLMSGGNLTIRSRGDNSKGISVDRYATISGGVIDIKSIGDGIKTDGNLTISGGNVTTESADKKGIDCKEDYSKSNNAHVERKDKTGSRNF